LWEELLAFVHYMGVKLAEIIRVQAGNCDVLIDIVILFEIQTNTARHNKSLNSPAATAQHRLHQRYQTPDRWSHAARQCSCII
jgi:hypothetical protein